ncbi:divergent polysaccharide deacteylase family protein [Roseovarius ramblicola]|uniref:Divergent polysaccharide deacetylase family protein n=1 Tax=Roseovarius ramblicola TaxID=2022336 RepID=A0ABV5I230_9RHOB
MRGVLAGMMTGLVVSGLVLGTASVVVDLADRTAQREQAPDAGAVEVPPGSGFDAVREDREAALPDVGDGPDSGAAPRVPAPEPDDTRGLSAADTAPPPDTGGASSLAAPPADGPDAGGVAVQSDSPVLPSPQAPAPAQPEGETRLTISTEPAQPPSPDPGESDAGLRTPDEPRQPPADDSIATMAPEEGTPETAPGPRRIEPEGGDTLPGDGGSDRLPRIGDAPTVDEAADNDARPAPPQGALARNAVAIDPPPDKPLMAVVLIDGGQNALGIEALEAFPYPLSIAIAATHPDAAGAAARYRDAGFEVLLAADLPPDATPAEVETAMAAMLSRVPQAVAVIEGDGTGLQGSRAAGAQLAPILSESGHGLVMRPNGLDTTRKLIAREGVPSATLFRDFDAQGQDAAAVRRFLDQAAMRANQQQDGVIMLGRLRADTISALLLWGLQDRAASVALVPVSAVLRRGAAN